MASPRPSRRLIVNADDFGRSRSINEAVIRAHTEGILTTASLMVNGEAFSEAVELARWKERLHGMWGQLSIDAIEAEIEREVLVGERLPIKVRITPGEIPLSEIAVEVYFGVLDSTGTIMGGEIVPLAPSDGTAGHFDGELECRFCGRHGFMLRVMPRHPELGTVYDPGLILWG